MSSNFDNIPPLVERLRDRAKGRELGYDGRYMLEAADEIERLQSDNNLLEIVGNEQQARIAELKQFAYLHPPGSHPDFPDGWTWHQAYEALMASDDQAGEIARLKHALQIIADYGKDTAASWCVEQACNALQGHATETPSGLYPHWRCDTHGDFDARVAVGCPECTRQMREALRRAYDTFSIGRDARTPAALLANIENARRRSDCLSAIEREFFTRTATDEDGEETQECSLGWGAEPDNYVEQFRVALREQAERPPVHPDPTGQTREMPHCPSCSCSMEPQATSTSYKKALEFIRDGQIPQNMSAPLFAERVLATSPLNEAAGGLLNPTWVEWLMGWPTGWTALEPLAMGRFREWQQQHGGCLSTAETVDAQR